MGLTGVNVSQNLVEVIREQQLAEWDGDCNPVIGTLQDDCKCQLKCDSID